MRASLLYMCAALLVSLYAFADILHVGYMYMYVRTFAGICLYICRYLCLPSPISVPTFSCICAYLCRYLCVLLLVSVRTFADICAYLCWYLGVHLLMHNKYLFDIHVCAILC